MAAVWTVVDDVFAIVDTEWEAAARKASDEEEEAGNQPSKQPAAVRDSCRDLLVTRGAATTHLMGLRPKHVLSGVILTNIHGDGILTAMLRRL